MARYEEEMAWDQYDIAVADGYEDDPQSLVWRYGEYVQRWVADADEAEELAMERDLREYESGIVVEALA